MLICQQSITKLIFIVLIILNFSGYFGYQLLNLHKHYSKFNSLISFRLFSQNSKDDLTKTNELQILEQKLAALVSSDDEVIEIMNDQGVKYKDIIKLQSKVIASLNSTIEFAFDIEDELDEEIQKEKSRKNIEKSNAIKETKKLTKMKNTFSFKDEKLKKSNSDSSFKRPIGKNELNNDLKISKSKSKPKDLDDLF